MYIFDKELTGEKKKKYVIAHNANHFSDSHIKEDATIYEYKCDGCGTKCYKYYPAKDNALCGNELNLYKCQFQIALPKDLDIDKIRDEGMKWAVQHMNDENNVVKFIAIMITKGLMKL